MRAQELANNLSVSLANSAWDKASVAGVLCRRLPPLFTGADDLAEGFPHRAIGWAVSNRIKRDLAIRVLKMAIAFRSLPKGCIHHTDRG